MTPNIADTKSDHQITSPLIIKECKIHKDKNHLKLDMLIYVEQYTRFSLKKKHHQFYVPRFNTICTIRSVKFPKCRFFLCVFPSAYFIFVGPAVSGRRCCVRMVATS